MERPLERPDEVLSERARALLRVEPPPAAAPLMQPLGMDREDPGPGWLFEPLFDGIRCLAVHDGSSVRLLEDGVRGLPGRFPELEEQLRASGPKRFALDGVIVRVDPAFEQARRLPESERRPDDGREHPLEPRYLAFDLIHAADHGLRGVPLVERRAALRALFRFSPTLMYVRESSAPGELVFSRAEREGWPGVVAKRAESRYEGGPSGDWRVWRRNPTR